MPRTTTFEFHDYRLGGKLGELLLGWRAEGLSNDRIARKLETELGIDVTGETVRMWVQNLQKAAS